MNIIIIIIYYFVCAFISNLKGFEINIIIIIIYYKKYFFLKNEKTRHSTFFRANEFRADDPHSFIRPKIILILNSN